MGIQRNVLKRNTLANLLGQPELNIDDLEYDYLSLLGANDEDHINVKWLTVFHLFGATANHINDAAQQFLVGQGAPYEHISSNWVWFWENGGIVITPDGVMEDAAGNFMIFADNDYAEYT
jgi:predicted GNAT superfamily acetyltransferase